MSRRSTALAATILIVVCGAAALIFMGRPAICTCGEVDLWGPVGPTQSQMLADWYSPSHVVHGFLFYCILSFAARHWPVERRFLAAVVLETLWEVAENTPMVIDRYRTATMALGYTGDSILNSVSDIGVMALGFLAARKLPLWASVLIVLLLELVPLWAVRDNLTLNVWMLLAPSADIRAWQAGA